MKIDDNALHCRSCEKTVDIRIFETLKSAYLDAISKFKSQSIISKPF